MKIIKKHLAKLTCAVRRRHSSLLYDIHKKYGVSKKTLFYIKEYGSHSHIARTILRESVKILLFASILSSFGGMMIEQIKHVFISFTPLIILLPALNAMFGDYGMIISSRFSTMLHEGKVGNLWWKNIELKKLFVKILIVSLITIFLSVVFSFVVSVFAGYVLDFSAAYKILLIIFLDSFLLLSILIFITPFAGLYFFKKQEDPNNFLIPITTSIADFGNMIILSLLVILIL